MKRTSQGLIAAALVAAAGLTAQGSSHREALAILNEPCADNTDTYAWVSPGSHDKLYLIMDFNPLHEPGQGNQGFRACDGYRYEFHIGKGASLRDQVVYRVEFTKRLRPEAPPSPGDPLGGGNELLWQLTGGTETMRVSRVSGPGNSRVQLLGNSWPSSCTQLLPGPDTRETRMVSVPPVSCQSSSLPPPSGSPGLGGASGLSRLVNSTR